jgi:hypothetical protein
MQNREELRQKGHDGSRKTTFLCPCPNVSLFLSLFVSGSVLVPVRLCPCLSLCPSVSLFLSVCVSVPVRLCPCPFVCLSTCVHIPIVSLLCPFPTDLSVIKVDRFKINFNQVELSVRKFWGRSAWTEKLKQDNCWKWLKMAENAENGWKCWKWLKMLTMAENAWR